MRKKRSVEEMIDTLKTDPAFASHVTHWHTVDARPAKYAEIPASVPADLVRVLNERGIDRLYTHQAEAITQTARGHSTVVVTPTASGKTLCYNLPVLSKMIEKPTVRALYLYPTKALAQDQNTDLMSMVEALEGDLRCFTYDGDTSPAARTKVRDAGNIVITNPDMLHSGILPHHTKWIRLFENLEYIVVDELHTYRGVFGSHVANVFRRLKRICAYYGSHPKWIMTSATIANPVELAERLTEEEVVLVDQNGAPQGRKHLIFYNPPVVNEALGIRRSATLETKRIASKLVEADIQTIVFARSRVRVEVLLTYLQELTRRELGPKSIVGYRGGYLPSERREIERRLRDGEIRAVVSTNALELGVDIGQLEACVLNGYPGTVASLWQQAGRAGRRHSEALVIFVASSSSLDQLVVEQPDLILDRSPEAARLDPNNLIILVDHLKCAAFELPFHKGERFGTVETEDILDFLTDAQVLHERADKYYWMTDSFPAHEISLRTSDQENVVIVDQTAKHAVIGEMDTFSAMTLLHDEAIYLHGAEQYQVEKLDFEEKKAYVRQVDVDYYTDANLAVELKVLEENKSDGVKTFGEVSVIAMATLFKKIKFGTHENIGSGPIHLPERELHTTATWFTLDERYAYSEADMEDQLEAVSDLLRRLAPLYLMCDSHDLFTTLQMKATHTSKPTVFLYDRYPGGIGLSEALYRDADAVLQAAVRTVEDCPCVSGCPSCVGTIGYGDFKQQVVNQLNALKGTI
ncbi:MULTISPECIES: DEAD/DEAH box helicase [Exiguobacterium]|uniref:DEAD/DEAH box helicase n=1 Tax=Exiguobacterium TaxID=33986 RepID=UPI001BEA8F57|nr:MULTISPECIES: DEAD/DEAH box helicase [Exiguobacterium]MCT4781763.1 DEAD/DEAH box helicase [Exiguobacterium himgiriensis]